MAHRPEAISNVLFM